MQVWLNGQIVEIEQARVHPFDRGFLFGDGVYEAVQYFNRVGVGMDLHIRRLERSLRDAEISGFDPADLEAIGQQLLEAQHLQDAVYYLQVTRGVQMPRHHRPDPSTPPTVFAYLTPTPSLAAFPGPNPRTAVTLEDDRWRRCGIKGISLMANVLAQIACGSHGADEAILHRDGLVSEGTSTNVFLVDRDYLRTPPVESTPSILAGVTRNIVIDLAPEVDLQSVIEPVSVESLAGADEILITSTRRMIDGIIELNGNPVGNGRIGETTHALFEKLRSRLAETCGVALHST